MLTKKKKKKIEERETMYWGTHYPPTCYMLCGESLITNISVQINHHIYLFVKGRLKLLMF